MGSTKEVVREVGVSRSVSRIARQVTPVRIGPSEEELVASSLATGSYHSLCIDADDQVR